MYPITNKIRTCRDLWNPKTTNLNLLTKGEKVLTVLLKDFKQCNRPNWHGLIETETCPLKNNNANWWLRKTHSSSIISLVLHYFIWEKMHLKISNIL